MIEYEWLIEIREIDPGEDGVCEIIDHEHTTECPGIPLEPQRTLALVRNKLDKYTSLDERFWAYEKGGELPEYFVDAFGFRTGHKVPNRFHKELKKIQNKG